MIKRKLQVPYIISVLLLLIILSNRMYKNINALSFLIPVIIGSLLIGVFAVYLFGKDMKLYKNLYFISYVITIGLAFVPVLGVYIEGNNYIYGFPAQWFSYYSSGYVSLELLGFLFNYFVIYLVLRFVFNIFSRFSKGSHTEISH
ncbi:PTS system, Fru family, IIC component [Oceanobacillus picturae]|uniref:PTS system, Fru family, IIC component n=1 Tax=Oceanobacillus picturae TaxID=171693 RepID=A0A0U9H718_9BACI|nr:hypothetical protein [Oceanobacillus picturae]GAQ18483.1 PTS system, Fru family, IIC component [Oceanobacillus picturae]